jgi:hypothetical protein
MELTHSLSVHQGGWIDQRQCQLSGASSDVFTKFRSQSIQ